MLIGPVRYYSALLEIPTVAPLPRNDINRQLVDQIYTGAYRKINDPLPFRPRQTPGSSYKNREILSVDLIKLRKGQRIFS